MFIFLSENKKFEVPINFFHYISRTIFFSLFFTSYFPNRVNFLNAPRVCLLATFYDIYFVFFLSICFCRVFFGFHVI